MKINITINEELLKRVDAFAKENYLTRSGFLAICATQYLNANELTSSIKTMSLAIRHMAETGNVSDEDLKQLKDFEVLSRLLSEGNNNLL